MNARMIIRTAPVLTLVALLPAALAAPPAQQTALHREGVELIRQVEEMGREIRYHAGRLTTFTRNAQASPATHFHHLDHIRTLVNDGLRPAIARLEAIQGQLPAWKQQSIDRMLDAAKALAANTQSAIVSKREALIVPAVMNAEYRQRIDNVYTHAEALVKTSDAAETYATARMKASDAGIPVPTT